MRLIGSFYIWLRSGALLSFFSLLSSSSLFFLFSFLSLLSFPLSSFFSLFSSLCSLPSSLLKKEAPKSNKWHLVYTRRYFFKKARLVYTRRPKSWPYFLIFWRQEPPPVCQFLVFSSTYLRTAFFPISHRPICAGWATSPTYLRRACAQFALNWK